MAIQKTIPRSSHYTASSILHKPILVYFGSPSEERAIEDQKCECDEDLLIILENLNQCSSIAFLPEATLMYQ